MEDYKIIVADNLKRLRNERKLSLDKAAKLTGISKSMIAQMEKGEVNPSISTMWKIASGFKISFTELMSTPESEVEIIHKMDKSPLIEDGGQFRNYPIVHFDPEKRFEIYLIEVDAGGNLKSTPHAVGTQEYVIVTEGQLKVSVSGNSYTLNKGDTIRFKADVNHGYENIGDKLCVFNNVIYYQKV